MCDDEQDDDGDRQHAKELFLQFASNGAFQRDSGRAGVKPRLCHESTPGLRYLLNNGLVQPAVGSDVCDHYYITPAGERFLSCPRHLCNPVPLSRHCRFAPGANPDSGWTRYELVVRLQQDGWQCVQLTNPAPKKTEPYRPGSPKIYYHHLQGNGGLYKEYLLALISSETLGREVYHFQVKAYYVEFMGDAWPRLLHYAVHGAAGVFSLCYEL